MKKLYHHTALTRYLTRIRSNLDLLLMLSMHTCSTSRLDFPVWLLKTDWAESCISNIPAISNFVFGFAQVNALAAYFRVYFTSTCPDIKWDRVQIFEPILISRLQAHREFKTFKYSNTCNSRHLTLIVIIRFVVIIIIKCCLKGTDWRWCWRNRENCILCTA